MWPSKSIPIKAHLNYHPESAKQVLGNLILLLVLAAGGIFSLLVNAYLPNRLRSVAADEKLGSLGGRISGISTKIDSRLRVLIRVERLRIKEMLKGRWHISPDFADALTQTNEGITALTSRVAAAEQLDSERHRFDSLRAKLLPTRLSRIHDDLQRAADLLRKFRPSKEDIDLATTSISKASELISKTEILVSSEAKDDEFAKSLAERLTQLREDFKPFELKTVYNKFQSHIPGPFERLAETAPDPTTSSPRDYTAIDIDLVKLAVILDYVRIHEGRSEALREKLQEPGGPEEQLMKLVIPLSWECLRSAQLLVRQVQCGIYEKDLREHLPHGVSIELNKQVMRVNEPIEFSLRFHHPVLDCTAAREEWSYTWAFGDGREERGWSAWHYFPKATSKDEPMPVQVHFMDAAGQPIKNGDQQITIPRPVPVQDTAAPRFGHRTKVEAARLAIGLLVAVVALAAGAKEKLLTLDVLPGLLAVFIIGFAADTIKNLVTQAPAKQ